MRTTPSDAELAILSVLWQCGPSTVREVHEALAKDTGYTCTLKQMQVMNQKGLLRRSQRYRSHLYEAATEKKQVQARIASDVLRRPFEGSAKDLILCTLSAKRASTQDLREIRLAIEGFERKIER